MNYEEGFLEAIREDPDDEGLRLVYADWLEEHGQLNRAEFIRGQIHLARVKEDSLPRRRLARRMRELLEAHEQEWLAALVPPTLLRFRSLRYWHFERGFVDKIGIDARELERHATVLFSSLPLTRLWVVFMDMDMEDTERLPIPEENTLTSLDLSYNSLNSDWLSCLATTTFPRLPHLRTLALMFNHLDDPCVPWMCRHPFFQQLALIRCGANPISQGGREGLRGHFGERVSFVCERDNDHLYAMQDDYLSVGFGRDDTQLLFRLSWVGVEVAVFDHEGNLLDISSREVPDWVDWQTEEQERFKQAWMRELGFESATIKFKRFKFHDCQRVKDFNESHEMGFDDWNHPEADQLRGELCEWLLHGHYQWDDSRNLVWFNGEGKVTMA